MLRERLPLYLTTISIQLILVIFVWTSFNTPQETFISHKLKTMKSIKTDRDDQMASTARTCGTELSDTDLKEMKMQPNTESCWSRKPSFIQCPKLMSGDPDELAKVRDMPKTALSSKTECDIERLAKNCPQLIRAHEYSTLPLSEEEGKYPLAFTIKMHKSVEQAEQLLRTIYRPHNIYCIYVDGKSESGVFSIMKDISKCFENVVVVEDRLNVVYASHAHVKSELQCMRLCAKSKVKWKYYINLTGQEFPLRTNLEMVRILKSLHGSNDIESYDHPVFLQWRHEKKFLIQGNSFTKTTIPKEAFKYNITLSKGSAYGLFTREFVDFVLKDEIAQDFILWLNDTYSPEENIWATLNTLPWAPGGYEVETRHRLSTFLSRAMIWHNEKLECAGQFVRDICVFSVGDLPWLLSRPEFIANKFDRDTDSVVLDCLEENLRNKTQNDDTDRLDWNYYRHLPHSQYYNTVGTNYASPKLREIKKIKWLRQQANMLARKP